MGYVAVLTAGIAAWVFGAVWYMALGKRWMVAAGVTEEDTKNEGPVPYIVTLLMAIVVAGMLRHVMATGGVHGGWNGLVTGLGLGAFIAAPWIVNNVMFGMRSKQLIWMDGLYPVIGMGIMGIVLAWLAPEVAA
ncbi:MAG: DUF1761 domain-containing protein [Shimia sp.]